MLVIVVGQSVGGVDAVDEVATVGRVLWGGVVWVCDGFE